MIIRAIKYFLRLPFIVISLLCWANLLCAQLLPKSDEIKLAHFEKHVRPALTKYCLECHATPTEANGGLVLDSRYGWEEGGDSGEAVVPGRPDESRLIKAIRYDNPKFQMPPDNKLPQDVAIFETWIADGVTNNDRFTIDSLSRDNLPISEVARQVELLQRLNRHQLDRRSSHDAELEAALESHELAWRMQQIAPDVLDCSTESTATQKLYGMDDPKTKDFGQKCLLARRLCESGVRFIEVNYGGDSGNWGLLTGTAKSLSKMRKYS
ncbi:MAG TPA: DUF1501 domain-containing protein [Pirellula sp.]|nr:DUF1501 domain-containing protein [Pirellula sp.]